MFSTKRELIFFILSGIFITNAVIAEAIGGKLFEIGPFVMSVGILPWPVVFLTTDLINEYYGKEGVRKISWFTAALIVFMFGVLFLCMQIPASEISPVKDEAFQSVFGQSSAIIIGSIIAFLVAQLVDVSVFSFFKNKTGNKMLWLRATGSTAISQLIDTFIVAGIGFWLTGKVTFADYVNMAATGYVVKLMIAVALTPLIYAGHFMIDKYMEKEK
ncbi:MAG: queuosine precursor transporter [Bacteroidota bacterium]